MKKRELLMGPSAHDLKCRPESCLFDYAKRANSDPHCARFEPKRCPIASIKLSPRRLSSSAANQINTNSKNYAVQINKRNNRNNFGTLLFLQQQAKLRMQKCQHECKGKK